MDHILGVDGGGTKTIVQITDSGGKLITESESKSSNYKSVGMENAKISINTAVLSAVESLGGYDNIIFKSACFGLSGNDSCEDRNIYHKIIFNDGIKDHLNPASTIICNDTRIGLAAGSDSKNRVMIICGTGSNCFGINQFNEEAKAGGWDYILDDEGSGYAIGLKALKAIIKKYDGRGKETLLSETILKALRLNSPIELMKWVYCKSLLKEDIAKLARLVCETAELGDKISIEILREGAGEAEIMVTTVTNKLDLKNENFDLVLVGSVFKCKKYFKDVLLTALGNRFPKINFKPLTKKPVEGAIKLAFKNL